MITYAGQDTYGTTLDLASDNEPVTAKTVADPIKVLADRTAFLMRRGGEFSHSGSGIRLFSSNGTQVQIAAGLRVTTYDTMPRYHFPTSSIVLDASHIEGAPGAFFGSRAYYVYVYWDEGAARSAYQISTSPPDAWGFKQGADSRFRFLGAFITDSAAEIVRFQRWRGQTYYYRMMNVLNGGVLTTEQEISCQAVVPAHATEAMLILRADATKDGFVYIGHKNSSIVLGDGYYFRVSPGSTTIQLTVPLSFDGSRTLFYFVDSADVAATLSVIGFYD